MSSADAVWQLAGSINVAPSTVTLSQSAARAWEVSYPFSEDERLDVASRLACHLAVKGRGKFALKTAKRA